MPYRLMNARVCRFVAAARITFRARFPNEAGTLSAGPWPGVLECIDGVRLL
jgi:hypothetical protein